MSHWRGKLPVPLESLNEANSLKWIFSSACTQQPRNQEPPYLHTCIPAHFRVSLPPKPPSAFEGSIQNQDSIKSPRRGFSLTLDMFTWRVVLRKKRAPKWDTLARSAGELSLTIQVYLAPSPFSWMLQFGKHIEARNGRDGEGLGAGGKAVDSPRFE